MKDLFGIIIYWFAASAIFISISLIFGNSFEELLETRFIHYGTWPFPFYTTLLYLIVHTDDFKERFGKVNVVNEVVTPVLSAYCISAAVLFMGSIFIMNELNWGRGILALEIYEFQFILVTISLCTLIYYYYKYNENKKSNPSLEKDITLNKEESLNQSQKNKSSVKFKTSEISSGLPTNQKQTESEKSKKPSGFKVIKKVKN